MRSNLDLDYIKDTASAYEKYKPFSRKSVLWDRVIQANYRTFKEAMQMGEVAKGLFFEVGDELGWFEERDNETNREAARKIAKGLKQDNVPLYVIEKNTGLTAQEIEEL